MNKEELILEIENCFTYVEKPQGNSLSFHPEDCNQCESLREELVVHAEKQISPKGIRCLHQEMSRISAKGWRWVLPSYLRFCIYNEERSRDETEFLIYTLGPSMPSDAETVFEYLAELKQEQLKCLLSFLMFCRESSHLSSYCLNEIDNAIKILNRIIASHN